jgi:hypothetical protein
VTAEDARVAIHIGQLQAEFSRRIDHHGGRGVADLFTPDGALFLPDPGRDWQPGLEVRGREAIAARWSGRPSSLATRHVFTNLHVRRLGPGRFEAHSIGLGFRHDGRGFGAPVPLVVADYDDVCRLVEGEWLFEVRRVSAIFFGPALGESQ